MVCPAAALLLPRRSHFNIYHTGDAQVPSSRPAQVVDVFRGAWRLTKEELSLLFRSVRVLRGPSLTRSGAADASHEALHLRLRPSPQTLLPTFPSDGRGFILISLRRSRVGLRGRRWMLLLHPKGSLWTGG